jgi:hypothetical protein
MELGSNENNVCYVMYNMAGFWGDVWGGAHLPWDRFAPPLRIFAPPLKRCAPSLGKVSMIDQSETLTFFGCLGSTLCKKVSVKLKQW